MYFSTYIIIIFLKYFIVILAKVKINCINKSSIKSSPFLDSNKHQNKDILIKNMAMKLHMISQQTDQSTGYDE